MEKYWVCRHGIIHSSFILKMNGIVDEKQTQRTTFKSEFWFCDIWLFKRRRMKETSKQKKYKWNIFLLPKTDDTILALDAWCLKRKFFENCVNKGSVSGCCAITTHWHVHFAGAPLIIICLFVCLYEYEYTRLFAPSQPLLFSLLFYC